MKGKFITFEGSEGCGKSTQSRLLYNYLRQKGHDVIYLREPGGTAISEKIRNILLDPDNRIGPECEMLLYMASRSEVVREIIKPALKQGKIVICDRFLDSTLAYQGYGLGMDLGFIEKMGDFVTGGIRPGLTILLDLAVGKGLENRRFSKDRIESRSLAYHQRVRVGYLKMAKAQSQRIKIIKVDKDKSVTQAKIRLVTERFLKIK